MKPLSVKALPMSPSRLSPRPDAAGDLRHCCLSFFFHSRLPGSSPPQMLLATYVIDDGSEEIHAMKQTLMRYLMLGQVRHAPS